jgi:hypothetical protein
VVAADERHATSDELEQEASAGARLGRVGVGVGALGVGRASGQPAIMALVPAGDPKHPVPFPFRGLTDGEFEELVYLVAHMADRDVIKTCAPDGGLDVVRPAEGAPLVAQWGLQAKLHRGHIHWSDCKGSLDRAVEQWSARHVTFVFPRDLTHAQLKLFDKHLARRHGGVKVDWWGETKLTAVMIGSEDGRTIAKRFFHAEDPADVADRATRAGGPLRTPADLLDREGAIGEFLRTASPHFEFHTTNRPRSDAEVPRAAGTAMRIELTDGKQQVTVDAVPRTPATLEHYGPKGSMAFKDRARTAELLERVRASGGRATLGEAMVRFERVPPPFDEIMTEVEGVVSIRAEKEPEPWAARIAADTDEGAAALDFDLAPTAPEREWDAKLVGQRNGLTMELRFVWHHDQEKGRLELTWRFDRASGSVRERAGVIALVLALHGKGTFSIEDRDQRRSTMSEQTVPRRVPDGLRDLRDVYVDLAEIEEFAGATFGPPPDEFSADEANQLGYLASLLRKRRIAGTVTSGKVVVGAEGLAMFRRAGSELVMRERLLASLFGRELPVAEKVTRLPPMQVRHATRLTGGAWEAELAPVAGDAAPVEIEFLPPRAREAPRSAG